MVQWNEFHPRPFTQLTLACPSWQLISAMAPPTGAQVQEISSPLQIYEEVGQRPIRNLGCWWMLRELWAMKQSSALFSKQPHQKHSKTRRTTIVVFWKLNMNGAGSESNITVSLKTSHANHKYFYRKSLCLHRHWLNRTHMKPAALPKGWMAPPWVPAADANATTSVPGTSGSWQLGSENRFWDTWALYNHATMLKVLNELCLINYA